MDAPPRLTVSGAGFGIRFLARLIDLIYGTALGFIAGIATSIVFAVLAQLGRLAPEWPQLIEERRYAGFGLGIVGAFLYHTVAEGLGTATIGKLICGLRVVQKDGRAATMKGAFIRDLAYHLDALFFGLVGYQAMKKGPLQQRYGDVWGNTVVVKDKDVQPVNARGPGRMFAAIFLGSCLWVSMVVLQLILKVL